MDLDGNGGGLIEMLLTNYSELTEKTTKSAVNPLLHHAQLDPKEGNRESYIACTLHMKVPS
jgi:hypothetical protein